MPLSPQLASHASPSVRSSGQGVTSRKRRRRAPAPGASEDCFACRKRQKKCDRRRPFCTVCLDQGKECSGYKQTLTWGIGVASRGKLRGSALPVVNKTESSSNTPHMPTKAPRSGSKDQGDHISILPESVSPSSTKVQQKPTTFDFVQIHPAKSIKPSPSPKGIGWRPLSGDYQVGGLSDLFCRRQEPNSSSQLLQRIQTFPAASFDDISTNSPGSSLSGFSDCEYSSPNDIPRTPDDHWGISPAFSAYPYLQPPQTSWISSNENLISDYKGPTSSPGSYPISENMTSMMIWTHGDYSPVEESPISAHFMGHDDPPLLFFDNDSNNVRGVRETDSLTGLASHFFSSDKKPAANNEVLPSALTTKCLRIRMGIHQKFSISRISRPSTKRTFQSEYFLRPFSQP
ncbi:MAG: hypothetical protein M1812_002025 [Candelaria pacifica]|nr:MAG: hypothetical protein M1812_002025 [Candelaria pacifica]